VAGRLAPGYSRGQAEAELTVLSAQFHARYKLDPVKILLADPNILSASRQRRDFMPVFALMFTGLILVLLLACANVSNLLIARAAARRREIEVRRALGAPRSRIVRQLLTEGFVIAFGAAALGLILAYRLPEYVFSLSGEGPGVHLTPDLKVMLYAAALAIVSCLAFALAPALQSARRDSSPTLKNTRAPLRNILLAGEAAISVVLLIGAGLMTTGVKSASQRDPGFRIRDVSVVTFEVPVSSYDSKRTVEFFRELSKAVRDTPELGVAGITAREPLGSGHWITDFRLPGEPADTVHGIEYQEVSAGYFDVLGVPIVQGRDFRSGDEGRQPVIVNESMARRYFGSVDAAGKTIIVGGRPRDIVGVARDASLAYLEGPGPTLFTLFSGNQIPKLLIRAGISGTPEMLSSLAKSIDPRARAQAAPLTENVNRQLQGSRVMAGVAGMLGIFALILAIVGISGVFSYVVEQRTKEIGIRMALGAAPSQVIALVLSGTARAAIIGLAIGYAAAAGFARLLGEYLYGVSPYDPRAYLLVVAVLAIAGLLAAYLPARRATRVDPLTALRVE
jgi:predicted permease